MAEQRSNTRPGGTGSTGSPGTGGSTPGSTGPTGATDFGSTPGASTSGMGASGGSTAGQSSGNLRQKVASTVASAADTQKNRAAEGLGSIADVARQTGEDLRGQNEMLASWVSAASDQLRTMADRLRDRPAAELAEDLTRFARERPAVFLGGAFLLGLGVARLLKASPEHAYSTGGNGRRGMHGGDYAESGMGGTVSGTGGAWSPSTGAY